MITLFWFRRDLRIDDNAGLYYALAHSGNVLPVFIFDKHILDRLEDKSDQRVAFIHRELTELKRQFESMGSSLKIDYGYPEEVFSRLISEYSVRAVYANHDYEPYARERDEKVGALLKQARIPFNTLKDQVIFERNEVMKDDGKPYTVFTPYMKKWKQVLLNTKIPQFDSLNHCNRLFQTKPFHLISLDNIGFRPSINFSFPSKEINTEIIKNYHNTRDYPSIEGTTRLSIHLRFGTISLRKLVKMAVELNETFLNELIWREFYMMILWHFPHSAINSFKKQYDNIPWANNEEHFLRWCEGTTGFPIVDAGMRQLNETGYMHNRVRMITASFLTKHLLIDWRWGEAYFAKKLLDYEMASNVGGWQWAAGSGCDAAPYFRIFNPASQLERFDPKMDYCQRWVPEYGTEQYPKPIVSHVDSRNRALATYKKALKE